MTKCEQCGTEAAPGATTCRECGATLPRDASMPPPPPPGASGSGTGDGTGGPGWGETGADQPRWGQAPPPAPRGGTDASNLGLLAHLSALVTFVGIPSFVGPLVMWLWQRDKDPFVEAHAREALNFNLSVLIYAIVGTVLAALIALITFGIGMFVIAPVAVVLAIAWFVLTILAGLAAGRGEHYRYPVTIRFVR